jgi:hypothetical protein
MGLHECANILSVDLHLVEFCNLIENVVAAHEERLDIVAVVQPGIIPIGNRVVDLPHPLEIPSCTFDLLHGSAS